MKSFKVLVSLGLALTMAFGGAISGNNNLATTAYAKSSRPNIDMKDIEWSVEDGISYGERVLMLHIKNNSKYTLLAFSIKFAEKEGVTDEQRNEFREHVKNSNSFYTDEDMDRSMEDGITLHATENHFIKPNQEVDDLTLKYLDLMTSVDDAKYYDLVTPDIAEMEVLSDGKIYDVYYDFVSDKIIHEGDPEKAKVWLKQGMQNILPKPNTEVYEAITDREDKAVLVVDCATQSKFTKYVKALKAKGFDNAYTDEASKFQASNDNGYKVNTYFTPGNGTIHIDVEKSESDD